MEGIPSCSLEKRGREYLLSGIALLCLPLLAQHGPYLYLFTSLSTKGNMYTSSFMEHHGRATSSFMEGPPHHLWNVVEQLEYS